MKCDHWKKLFSIPILVLFTFGLLGCAGMQTAPKAKMASIAVIPAKTVLSPALIKKPIQITGSGFEAKETVVIEMVIPPGVTVKTVPEGENVGLAFATADEKGNITAEVGAVAVLNWFFQVGWTPNMKPVFEEATPLKPGKYTIVAEGMDSGAKGEAVLEFIPPPKKK
jgi:hypothetical protein